MIRWPDQKRLKKDDRFIAIVKKSSFSCTLDGVEGAGRMLGPFVASEDASNHQILAEGRKFLYDYFAIARA